jgi:hypothetical protein
MSASHLSNENELIVSILGFNKGGADTSSPAANKLGPAESSPCLKIKCGADESRPRRIDYYPWGY